MNPAQIPNPQAAQKPSPEVIQTYMRLFQENAEAWKFGAKYLEVLANKITGELKQAQEELDACKKKYELETRRSKNLETQLKTANEKINTLQVQINEINENNENNEINDEIENNHGVVNLSSSAAIM